MSCWAFPAAAQQPPQPADATTGEASCPPRGARVTAAYRVDPVAPADAQPNPKGPVELGDQIALEVKDLTALLDCHGGNADNPLVLFLSGHPFPTLVAYPPADPGSGIVNFELRISDDTRDAWDHLLGSPQIEPITVTPSIGPQRGYPVESAAELQLRVVPRGWLAVWIVIFVALCFAFFQLARRTNILRAGGARVPGPSDLGPFSLSKTQAAWWFFVILAAYLLIGLITGDFSTSINGTALALLGIGAATAVGSAMIDASKDNPQTAAAQEAGRRQAGLEIDQLEREVAALQGQLADAAATDQVRAKAAQDLAEKEAQLASLKSSRDKLVQKSEGFLKDIVSDANGASFHRFQVVAWTIVLSLVSIRDVYLNLAMPDFDPTLLGLQGLSAATYLGLKTQEPTVPTNAGGPAR